MFTLFCLIFKLINYFYLKSCLIIQILIKKYLYFHNIIKYYMFAMYSIVIIHSNVC